MALSAPEAARQLAQCRNSESVRKDQLSSYWKQFGIDLSIVTYQDRDVQIGQKLARLNFLSRPLVMKKITGKLRPAVEAALSHVSQRPYLVGYSRQPFRDPKGEHSAARASGELLTSSVLWRCAYDQPIEWFAEWIGYLEEGTHHYGRMEYFLAAAIDAGNKVVLSTLLSSLDGTHPIGVTSGAGIRALLLAENPTGWNAVERLLLSAGRAEGLRQTIVECADELNPRAFRRVLRHIVEHDLLRFSSVARAYSLWFPGLATVPSTISANRVLSMVLEMLDDRSLEPDESFHQVYLRLWTDAFDDVQVAVKRATKLITSSSPEVRLAVTVACGELRHTLAGPVLKTALSDRDRNIVDHALIGILGYGETPELKKLFSKDLYRIALERKGTEASPLGLKSEQLWSLAARFSEKSELIAIAGSFSELPANTRSLLACLFDEIKDQKVRRQLALSCLADGQEFVRHRGAKELERDPYDDETFAILEKHLSKKGSSIRSEVLTLLAGQKGQGVLDCAARLSASDNENQKRGGEELYKLLAAKGQSVPGTPKVSDAGAPPRASRYNVFGLADPSQVTFFGPPKAHGGWTPFSAAAVKLIQDLDDYILTRQDEDMMSTAFYQPHLVRVGDMTYNKCHCPSIQRFGPSLVEADKEHSFIVSLFEWFQKYEISEDDLTRAFVIANEAKSDSNSLNSTSVKSLQSHFKTLPRHLSGVRGLLEWLLFSRPRAVIPLLNALERIADDTHKTPLKFERGSWRSEEVSWRTAPLFECLAKQLPSALERSTEPISKEEWRRIFALYKYIDEPGGLESRLKANDHFERSKGDLSSDFAWMSFDDAVRMRLKLYPREPIPIQVLMGAFEAGVCSEVDLYDQLIFHVAAATSGEQKTGPVTQSAILKFVDHVIAIESGRGDAPAPTTPVVKQVYGLVSLNSIKLLLSKSTDLSRATAFRESGKEQCFAVLLRNATPPTSDNRADYVKELRALKLKPKLLLQLGMLAPQLGNVIEEILQMDGLEDAIWWMHAHTKDNEWDTSKLLRSFWNGNISERTALTPGDLEIGSCDSVWYHTVREKISDSQWKDLDKYAKFASTGTGHARAQLFAKALSGLVSLEELLVRVADKRNLNSLRAIGLVPLGADREADLRQRYMVLQDFLVSSRQFGSARQESEKLATEVALTNLAITAGYRDRLRLIWAMEANEVRDIQLGGAKVVVDSVELSLQFDSLGQPEIVTFKAGKLLADIPAAIKKIEPVKALVARRSALKKQLVRMRSSLEEAMQRSDCFTPKELLVLQEHPGLSPLLQNLVFVSDTGKVGFPSEIMSQIAPSEALRVAHPYDLLQSGRWKEIQEQVFNQERVQPFKQVFRELYILTEEEKSKDSVTRFGGHQLRPAQALAILAKRGWVVRHEEGLTKTFHALSITAVITADEVLYSPADIEGVTLEAVEFRDSRTYQLIKLVDVPSILFSEVMRDVDLVVSVAHSTGIDPEATESTVEMRKSVVEQTCKLLSLSNVTFIPRHVKIKGSLAEYTVNLSSGTVHQSAKGELVIIAVRQPQRGRLFLPFVDDDPRTAEIVSKVILLARDSGIKDPTILSQIVGAEV